jgi:hypothetical protein
VFLNASRVGMPARPRGIKETWERPGVSLKASIHEIH